MERADAHPPALARRRALPLFTAIGIVTFLMIGGAWAIHPPLWPTHSSPTPPSAPACTGTDARAATPNGPHGIYALLPPLYPTGPYYQDVQQYLRTNPDVCGAVFQIHWSDVDRGPGAIPRYNWTGVDQKVAAWGSDGRVVDLLFESVGYVGNQTWVPPYVLSQVGTVQCGPSSVTPLFWQAPYVTAYKAFIRAAVDHYAGNHSVGYFRFGLGIGSEIIPVANITTPGCLPSLNASGFSIPLWEHYLGAMLDFEHSLNSTIPLMVALDDCIRGPLYNVTVNVAAKAASDGIALGVESLQAADVVPNGTASPNCRGTWCAPLAEYAGTVASETQFLSASSPNGTGATGSLVPLVTLAEKMHVQILEMYLSDLLLAFDPNYPGYAAYHASYAAALDSAAATMGMWSS